MPYLQALIFWSVSCTNTNGCKKEACIKGKGKNKKKTKDQLIKELEKIRRKYAGLEEKHKKFKTIKKELETERDKFKIIVSSLSEGIDIIDKNYRICFQNQQLINRFGDLRGKLCFEVYMGRQVPCEFCLIQDAFKTGKSQTVELTAPDGRVYVLTSTPFKDIDGKTKVIEVVRDITKLKKNDEKIKESERRFRELFDHMSSGVAIYEAEKNGNDFVFVDFNRAGEKIDEIKKEDVIGKSLLKVFPGIKEFGLLDVLKRVWKTGKPERFPIGLYKDNRISGWRENYILKLPSGKIVAIYGDITERKKAEERLKASEKRFKEAIMSAPLPVMIHREDGKVVSVNEAWSEMTGYTKEEIPTIEIWTKKAYGKRKKIVKKNIDRLYGIDRRIDEGEYEINTKKGYKRIWHFSSSPMGKSSDGNRLVVSMALDVTEEKKRKEEYKNVINGMNDTAFVIGFNGKFVDVNERAVEVLGYAREELLKMGPIDIDPNLSSKDIGLLIEGMKTSKKQVFSTEHKTRDGRVIPVEISSSRIMYDGESHILSIARDISKRKEAEEALRKSEEEYRAVFENTGTAMIIIEENMIISLANRKFEELSGFSKDEIEGKKGWRDFVIKEDLKRMEKYHVSRRKESSNVPKEYEFRFIGKDKKIKDILIYVDMIPGTGKSIASLLEITERRKAVEALKESEERFQTVIENIPHGVSLHNLDGEMVLVNKALCDMTGYSKEELLKMKVSDIDPASQSRDDKEKFWMQMKKGGAKRLETTHYRKDGSYYPAEIYLSAFTINGRKMIVAIAHDITKRVEALESLSKSEEKYRNLYESLPDAFVKTDLEGNILEFNKHYLDMFGYTSTEIKKLKTTDLTPEKWFKHDAKIKDEQIMKRGYSDVYEKEYIRKDGAIFPIEIRSFLLNDEKGKPQSIWSIIRDISGRKKTEKELRKVERLESLGVLAGGIAHDFNNLLTGILGNISLAQIKQGEDVEGLLEDAKQASIQAKNLTQQLLTFAKGGEPVKGEVSIENIIKIASGFTLHGSNVKCVYEFSTDLWKVEVDKGQMSQVIDNLVINAKQSMPSGGEIKIKAENIIIKKDSSIPLLGGKYVKITFSDEGMGIPKNHLSRIFDPYFTTKQKGSGLGLATVFSVIQKHDGYVTVESEPGKGTTFYIYLPVKEGKKVGGKTKRRVEQYLKGEGRVLVMDDEETIRNTLGGILKKLGYAVTLTTKGEEALKEYKKAISSDQPYDIVILDLTIAGGMGGKRTMEELLKIDSNVRAVVSSGYSTDPIMAHFDEYGFKAVAVKPYDVDELVKAIRKAFE